MNEYPPINNIPSENIPTPNTSANFKAKFFNGLKLVLAFVLTGAAVYIILTAPSYWEKIKYQLYDKNNSGQIALSTKTASQEVVYLPDVQNQTTAISSENQTVSLKDLENNYLIIPKINVKVPIIWNSPAEEKAMLENLRSGVAHYGSTPLPNSGKGPVFITGHSSYYWWDKGLYKTIFANLDQLENDDEVALAYDNVVYIYKVFDKIVVNPDQIEVLNEVNEPILDLMTCVPIGTNLRRLIVKAKQVTPTKTIEETTKNASPTTQESADTNLPKTLVPDEGIELLPWDD